MHLSQKQIDKVSHYANVSNAEARAALEQSDGCPLDAVILLEHTGRTSAPEPGAWSTQYGSPPQQNAVNHDAFQKTSTPPVRRYTKQEIRNAVLSLLRSCTRITIDVWRKDDLLVGIPLIICVLLFVVAPRIMVCLAVAGLILRCRYHVSGWETRPEIINRALDKVAETVSRLSGHTLEELKSFHQKHSRKK